jgi:nucleoid DNA-binding protein
MTKKDMARAIAEEACVPKIQALDIIQQVFDGIIETLVQDGRIELRNFGVFAVKRRKPRQSHNPRTGEKVSVPEKLVVTFKPGLQLEMRVSQSRQAVHQD